ncbi:MAG: hypothetical protein GY737_13360 [Desulfobacteraceae bacterium]|nr:hypothetical protein [Desulfobacteraceae bacterium]
MKTGLLGGIPLKSVEFLPLTLFLLLARSMDTSVPENWKLPFVAAGGPSLLVTLVMLLKRMPLNRIFLGINLYLASGALAFITRQWWLNQLYDRLQASGMLAWVCLVGVITTLAAPRGFINSPCPGKERILRFSIYLLCFSLAAFAVSFGFQGNRVMSEMVPFMGLFTIQAVLQSRLSGRE